jgi:hypothetical protein
MAESQLSATTNSGQQSATQSPQVAGQPALAGATASNVQPGTSNDLLNGQGSIPLSNQQVTTVNLSPAAEASTVRPVPSGHHPNLGLIIITIVLLLIAAGSAIVINRSAKNTTY